MTTLLSRRSELESQIDIMYQPVKSYSIKCKQMNQKQMDYIYTEDFADSQTEYCQDGNFVTFTIITSSFWAFGFSWSDLGSASCDKTSPQIIFICFQIDADHSETIDFDEFVKIMTWRFYERKRKAVE